MADYQHFLLISRYSLREPVENFFPAAALRMLAKPAILVVEHLDVFAHSVSPIFDISQIVIVPRFPGMIIDDLFLFLMTKPLSLVSNLICQYQVKNFKDLVLDFILINKVKYVAFDCREVSYLEYSWSLIIVFGQ